VLFDPQFYAASLRNARDGHLSEYPFHANDSGLGRNQFRPRQIQRYVSNCLEYQSLSLPGLAYLVSPSVPFDDFSDSWSQIALNMAEASVDDWQSRQGAPPLLVTIVLSESSLRDFTRMNEFLDTLSTLDTAGFYVLVQRTSAVPEPAMDITSMANLLYFVYVLASLNDYRVVVGYSDWMGGLFQSVGATFSASGWHNSLRQFTLARFMPQRGGRRARKRYSSLPLLSCPLVVPELEDVFLAGLLGNVLTGGVHDRVLSRGPRRGEGDWTDVISCLAHWESLSRFYGGIESQVAVSARLNTAEQSIRAALALYAQLQASNVYFEAATGPDHLSDWLDSLRIFRNEATV